MKRTEPPNEDEFNKVLDWLDPDRERAAEKYEEIHRKIVKILVWRQCYEAEEMWDETFNRVCHLFPTIAGKYKGDPALYFHGVMRLVHLEWLKYEKWKKERVGDGPPPSPPHRDDIERLHACLDKCLNELDADDRELILKYYEKEKRAKIEHRKELAAARRITLNTLRMQVHRMNGDLRKCIDACLNDSSEAGNVLAG